MMGRSLSTEPRGYVRTPDDATAFWQLGNLWRIVATGHQTGGSLCAIDQLVADEGGGPGVHLHPSDEGLYVVSGHCTFYAGGTTAPASVRAGLWAFLTSSGAPALESPDAAADRQAEARRAAFLVADLGIRPVAMPDSVTGQIARRKEVQ